MNRPNLRRSPLAPLAILFALSLFISGCCGGCCRGCCAGLSGAGGSGSPSGSRSGPSASPTSGSVASLVSSRVGNFTLKGTAPVTRLGAGLSPGVIDSIGAVYTDPGGTQLNQIILAYSSEAETSARMETVYQSLSSQCQGKRLQRGNVLNQNGGVIGKLVVCDQSPQHVYWSNGRVLSFVTAPHPSALEFYNAAPN